MDGNRSVTGAKLRSTTGYHGVVAGVINVSKGAW